MEIKIFQINLEVPSTRQVDLFEYSTPGLKWAAC